MELGLTGRCSNCQGTTGKETLVKQNSYPTAVSFLRSFHLCGAQYDFKLSSKKQLRFCTTVKCYVKFSLPNKLKCLINVLQLLVLCPFLCLSGNWRSEQYTFVKTGYANINTFSLPFLHFIAFLFEWQLEQYTFLYITMQ